MCFVENIQIFYAKTTEHPKNLPSLHTLSSLTIETTSRTEGFASLYSAENVFVLKAYQFFLHTTCDLDPSLNLIEYSALHHNFLLLRKNTSGKESSLV